MKIVAIFPRSNPLERQILTPPHRWRSHVGRTAMSMFSSGLGKIHRSRVMEPTNPNTIHISLYRADNPTVGGPVITEMGQSMRDSGWTAFAKATANFASDTKPVPQLCLIPTMSHFMQVNGNETSGTVTGSNSIRVRNGMRVCGIWVTAMVGAECDTRTEMNTKGDGNMENAMGQVCACIAMAINSKGFGGMM
eukprot:TCALIF_02568-PA protein Name:"Protein of unknown function" AED:0.07 eAED:0.12 QI:333/0.66/0.75/1/0.66/0.75/4/96/192